MKDMKEYQEQEEQKHTEIKLVSPDDKTFGKNETDHKKEDKKETCPICLISLSTDEVQTLNCGHQFHRNCVQQWFTIFQRTLPRCPICRTEASSGDYIIDESVRRSRVVEDEDDFDDLDVNLNDLFGVFETDEGENVMIYESAMGIVMIQTLRVPQGLRVVALPSPLHRPFPISSQRRNHPSNTLTNRRGFRICRWFRSRLERVRDRWRRSINRMRLRLQLYALQRGMRTV